MTRHRDKIPFSQASGLGAHATTTDYFIDLNVEARSDQAEVN